MEFKAVKVTLFAGACANCGGEGQTHYLVATGGPEPDAVDEPCDDCGGTGLVPDPLRDQVIEFHVKYGQPGVGEGPPKVPADEVVRFRLRLIFEEAFEFMAACVRGDAEAMNWFQEARLAARRLIDTATVDVDLPEAADGLVDLAYVVQGTHLAFGIDSRPLALAVHRSNMSKDKVEHAGVSKPKKGAAFIAPDIVGELRKQGWAA